MRRQRRLQRQRWRCDYIVDSSRDGARRPGGLGIGTRPDCCVCGAVAVVARVRMAEVSVPRGCAGGGEGVDAFAPPDLPRRVALLFASSWAVLAMVCAGGTHPLHTGDGRCISEICGVFKGGGGA